MPELSITIAEYDQLVQLIYDGIQEQAPWSSFLRRFSEVTNSHDASLIFSIAKPEPDYFLLTSDPKFNLRSDSTTKHLLSMSEMLHTFQPQATTLSESLDVDKFFRSELYQTYLKPLDIKYMIGQDIIFEDSLRVKFSAERTSDKPDYGDSEKALFEMLTPHFRRAIHLREELLQHSRLREITSATLSKISIGCIMLDAEGQVISTNHMADSIIADGRGLTIVNQRLRAKDNNRNIELKKLITEALEAALDNVETQAGIGFTIEEYPGEPMLDMVIKPITKSAYNGTNLDPTVAIYINDCKQSNIELNIETLRKLYGMTRCEAQVSVHLADGKSQAEAAELLNVSINTVKTHLRGVYEKLGVRSQSQVVAILNRSSARLL